MRPLETTHSRVIWIVLFRIHPITTVKQPRTSEHLSIANTSFVNSNPLIGDINSGGCKSMISDSRTTELSSTAKISSQNTRNDICTRTTRIVTPTGRNLGIDTASNSTRVNPRESTKRCRFFDNGYAVPEHPSSRLAERLLSPTNGDGKYYGR